MWYLDKVPQVIHFFWGGKKLSFLQFLSVYTFWQLNPHWTIKVHTSLKQNKQVMWSTKEQEYADNYDDFTEKLFQIPIKMIYHDFDAYNLPNLNEVHKSDILRLKLLANEGGVYSDMDILFTKPISALERNREAFRDKDTFVSVCHYGHSIGFLMSSPQNEYFNDLFSMATKVVQSNQVNGYQSIGAPMVNSKYRDINTIPGNVCNLSMDTVYPYNAQQIDGLFKSSDMSKITNNTIGVHWFAGAKQAGEYLNATNGGLSNLPDCVVTNLIRFFNNWHTNCNIPEILPRKKLFLLGVSGTGKTTFAKNYSKQYNIPYFDFDLYFGIVCNGWQDNAGVEKFFNLLPDSFITEFVTPNLTQFNEYASKHDVGVILVNCSNLDELKQRLTAKNIELTEFTPNKDTVNALTKKGLVIHSYDSRTI